MDNSESTNFLSIPFEPSTIENIDRAVFEFVDKDLDISCKTNKGFEKVPIIWQGSERAWYTKKDPREKDILNFPVITIARTGMTKDKARKGIFQGNISNDSKEASIIIAKRVMQKKTAEFSNAFAKQRTGKSTGPRQKRKRTKTVYDFISIPPVVHINPTYEVTLTSLYVQQMNEMLQPFLTRTGNINYHIVQNNHHRYELFIQPNYNTSDNSNSFEDTQRKFEAKISFDMVAYLFGSYVNDELPKITIKESIVEYKFPKENLILGMG